MKNPSRTGSRLIAALRALAALAALLALLVGLPALLWLFTTTLLPHGVSGSEVSGLLTQHQNVGTPFLACLLAAGWLAWAAFALCVLLEIPSQLAGRPGVRLPALGAPQRLAAFLVGAILVLLPTTSALAAPAPAHAATARPLVAVTAPLTAGPSATPATHAALPQAGSADTSRHPQYTVKDRDSLWSIAQHHLGDGTRWKDLAQLNTGRTMTDGTQFNADTIQPGWILLLPDDATSPDLAHGQGTAQASPAATAGPTLPRTAVTPPPPSAASTVGTVSETSTSPAPTAAGDETTWPTHTVQSATESPWDLAVTYLGDGQRWADIAALNPAVPQIAANRYLPQGAVIKLPADARPTTPTTAAPTTSATPDKATPATPHQSTGQSAHVTVQEGDSLWSIAGDAYGDPTKWPTIFDANQGEDQPDGGHFTNPDLIYPGEELDVPAISGHVEAPSNAGKPTPPPADDQAAGEGSDSTAPSAAPNTGAGQQQGQSPASPTNPAIPAPSGTASQSPTPRAPSPAATANTQDAPTLAPAAAQRAEETHALAPAEIWLGAGALAAALVGTVALRRRLQQRRLRPGRHIPMPTGRAAATEQSLRAAQHPTGFDLLDRSLRTLALNLASASRELPVVEAVVLHESRVELHLDKDTVPVKPFTAAPGRTDVWNCSASSPDLAEEDALADADTPYPALISIGWDNHKHLVLVDLEHIGILHLAGDPDFARHVLQAAAVELATTPLAGHLEIAALGETAPGLETAAPERVARTTDLAEAATGLTAHTNDQRRALTAIGADSPRTARLSDAADAWTPHIVLAENLPDGDDTDRLFDALTQQPRTAAAVITTTASAGATADAGWTLTCHSPGETVILPGSRLPVHLQGLSDEHFADAVEILALASSDADVPAPARITAPSEDESENESAAATDLGEDGLPAEYAELEQEALGDDPAVAQAEAGTAVAAPLAIPSPATQLLKNPPAEDQGEETAGLSLADVLAGWDHGSTDAGPTTAEEPDPWFADLPTVPAPLHQPPAVPVPPVPAAVPAPPAPANTPTPPGVRETKPVAAESGPSVQLLGPLTIEGAAGRIDSNRRRTATELIAYLALNPGVDHHAIDAAMSPGQIVGKTSRNALISRARTWLGTDPDGTAYFPRVQDTPDNRYRLARTVTCDWARFQHHARTGLADFGEDGDLALRRALALVRGRPFTGIDPGRFAWAEPAVQGMVSEITHVAYELSTRRLEARDIPGALWAARQGLLAAEENEVLHRCVFRAHHAAGDIDALRASAALLTKINHQLGDVDMETETAALLQELLPRPVPVR